MRDDLEAPFAGRVAILASLASVVVGAGTVAFLLALYGWLRGRARR